MYQYRPLKPGVELSALIDLSSKHRAHVQAAATSREKVVAFHVCQYLQCWPTRVARRMLQSYLSMLTSDSPFKKGLLRKEWCIRDAHSLVGASLLASEQ